VSNGKPLENAIKRAAVEYRRRGLCALIRQNPAMANVGGVMEYVGTAPLDFVGLHKGGRALFVECKATAAASLSVVEDHFGADQVAAGNVLQDLGADGWLVVDYERVEESYALPWQPVRDFFAAPWRKSLTLDFARAHGLLLPSTSRNGAEPWKLWFLDGKPHTEREAAYLALAADKAKAAGVVVSLLPPEPEQRTKRPEKLTKEQRLEGVRMAIQDGLVNAARAAKRPKPRWAGGRR
jgi:hypothetical protein